MKESCAQSNQKNILGEKTFPALPVPDVGLYFHIPFCAKRCHFCSFYLVMQQEGRIDRFLRALELELSISSAQLGKTGKVVSTVYVGGGTPTILSSIQLSRLLEMVGAQFSVSNDCEVTVEATPETLTPEYLNRLLEVGVTRLSIGIQTFNQTERTCLGLSCILEQAYTSIQLVKQSGFTNFNIDLIYGIPGQTLQSWDRTLKQACAYEPTHLSCYALSVEEGTLFAHAFQRGELNPIETELESQFLAHATKQFALAGYEQYEISNWAIPRHACRHNLRYWQGKEYLGLGPSAQSYMDGWRFGNEANLDAYCRRIKNGVSPVIGREHLTTLQQDKERVVFGLRLLKGVPNEWIGAAKCDPIWSASFTSLLNEKYLVQTSERVALSAKGRQFADEISLQLI